MHALAINLPLDLSRLIAQAFVAGVWQGLILISIVAIFLRFGPRLSAAVRFMIWGLTFALVATLPLFQVRTLPLPRLHPDSSAIHLGAGWGLAIAAAWVCLMAVRIAQLQTQANRLHQMWKRALPFLPDTATSGLLHDSPRVVELCTSGDVDAPTVIGFFSPRLLIPEWLVARLAPSEIQQIVLHECEHLRRYDDWINLGQKIGLALFPLNPALLWMDRRLSLERELACDAGVVASTAAPFDYAHCLTRLAEHRLHRRSLALSFAAWTHQSELARRVYNLLRPAHELSPSRVRLSVTLICVGLGIAAVQMARVPQLVSFADVASATVADATAPATEPKAMRAIPVVYRETAQSRPTLLKAVMPSRRAQRAAHASSLGVKMQKARAARTALRPRVVLTAFEIRSGRPDFSTDAFRADADKMALPRSSSSYAAVEFGDGWLILQL